MYKRTKKNFIIVLGMLFFIFNYSIIFASNNQNINISQKYNNLNLNGKISFNAFKRALEGYNQIDKKMNNIITIVDFTKPSNENRMYVIDLNKNKILISTVVSHGKKTGDLYATNFSNKNGSLKSSPGFFLTGKIYKGCNGDSLELYGLEKGVNDNVRKRNIVVHGANYANPNFISKYGRLGRSKGCFAVPNSINKNLINIIDGGTVFYVHTKTYENKKIILK